MARTSPRGRRERRTVEPLIGANLAIRLIQVHMCVIYLFSGLGKLKGDTWWEGSAIRRRHVVGADAEVADGPDPRDLEDAQPVEEVAVLVAAGVRQAGARGVEERRRGDERREGEDDENAGE